MILSRLAPSLKRQSRRSLHAVCTLALVLPNGAAAWTRPQEMWEVIEEARESACFRTPALPRILPESRISRLPATAESADPLAAYRLAGALLANTRSRGDHQALYWLERATLAGQAAAAADLGSMHAAGEATPRDDARAAAWWLFGATRGDQRAMACLSAAYLLGRGVPRDFVEAAVWAIRRQERSRGLTLLPPSAGALERALPSSAFLEARRRAAIPAEPSPLPPLTGPSEPHLAPSAPTLSISAAWIATEDAAPRLPPRPPAGTVPAWGTGVVVAAPGIVLTSAHVVRDCAQIDAHAGLARLGGATIRARNERFDLALLSVPGLTRRPLPVSASVRLGSEVVVIGYPGAGVDSERPTATMGNVSAIGADRDAWLVQFTAPIQPGNSGGPLLDRGGQVVGIAIGRNDARLELRAGLSPSQNVNFAVGPAVIARFLEDHGIGASPANGSASSTADLAEGAERSLVKLVCHRPAPQASDGGSAGAPRANVRPARSGQ